MQPKASQANASQWAVAVATVAARYEKGTPILLTVGPWLPADTDCGVLCNFSQMAVEFGRSLGYNLSYYRYEAGVSKMMNFV